MHAYFTVNYFAKVSDVKKQPATGLSSHSSNVVFIAPGRHIFSSELRCCRFVSPRVPWMQGEEEKQEAEFLVCSPAFCERPFQRGDDTRHRVRITVALRGLASSKCGLRSKRLRRRTVTSRRLPPQSSCWTKPIDSKNDIAFSLPGSTSV